MWRWLEHCCTPCPPRSFTHRDSHVGRVRERYGWGKWESGGRERGAVDRTRLEEGADDGQATDRDEKEGSVTGKDRGGENAGEGRVQGRGEHTERARIQAGRGRGKARGADGVGTGGDHIGSERPVNTL